MPLFNVKSQIRACHGWTQLISLIFLGYKVMLKKKSVQSCKYHCRRYQVIECVEVEPNSKSLFILIVVVQQVFVKEICEPPYSLPLELSPSES